MPKDVREEFLALLQDAVKTGAWPKLTLSRHRGADASLKNLFVRPVSLKAGPRLSFLWRHATQDIAKNHTFEEGLALLGPLIGGDFLEAHLFTGSQAIQLECRPDGTYRLRRSPQQAGAPAEGSHDRPKAHPIPADSGWLQALGITGPTGKPREGMAPKYRQIQKFTELLSHLLAEAALSGEGPVRVTDMGSGKGYLTFAVSALLGERSRVLGIEARPELVELCNRVASEQGFAPRLSFAAGTIAEAPVDGIDVLIALHACDTATDDALARGIAAGAQLIVVAPCCHKELRAQLGTPEVLSGPLRHGIFQERQAEFATDALRSELLEWAGYRVKVFEFVSTEHTPKNLMIAAVKARPRGDSAAAERIRSLARFYGVKTQALARGLGLELA